MSSAVVGSPRERRKKWREDFQLRRFFTARGDLRAGVIEAGESPEFVMTGARRVGIEVVEIRGDDSVSQLERYTVDALDVAHRTFREAGGPPLLVTVAWHRLHSMPPMHSTEAGQRLAGLIQKAVVEVVPGPGGVGISTEFIMSGDPARIDAAGLAGILANYDVERFCPPFESWRAPAPVFWRPKRPRVEELLSEKGKKLKKFRPCDEHWLLMVAEGRSPSGCVDCRAVAAVPYDFAFDRVFAMDSEVFELRRSVSQDCAPAAQSPGGPSA